MAKKFGLVIDLKKCIECHACSVACKIHNEIEPGKFLTQVLSVPAHGKHPFVGRYPFPKVCMQCENAPCERVCPAKATRRDERGVVVIDEKKCVGCKYCMIACPYGARSYSEQTHVVQKCNLCAQRASLGKQPVCVETCMTGARIYGDLSDPTSEAYRISQRPDAFVPNAHLGTRPVIRYLSP